MIHIHPVHRRLAELSMINKRRQLTYAEQMELFQCLQVNADLVYRIDALKELAYQAHVFGDMEWVQEICQQLDELEAKCV